MMTHGAQIKGIRNLHAKLYLFGRQRAMITSANLTGAGLRSNDEFGCVSDEAVVVAGCLGYFDTKWAKANPASVENFTEWQSVVTSHHAASGEPTLRPPLPDYGSAADEHEPVSSFGKTLHPRINDSERFFVKFFGTGTNRLDRSVSVLDEVKRSISHSVLSYPFGRRPRQIKDGDLVFIARLVRNPNDIMIYGRATGMQHDEERDNASAIDIERRGWRADWPHYIRVHHAEFMGGSLENAIPLSMLMDELKHEAFASTSRNFQANVGNTDPRHAFQQKPSVRLTPAGAAWINDRLVLAFEKYGTLSPASLDSIV